MNGTLSARRFRFARFVVDARTRELTCSGALVPIPDQSVEVLLALLERPGEVVTRDELRARLWSADTFVDFEHGLNSAVRRLRQALGDSADAPTFIETLPRRGYRFVAAASAVPDTLAPPSPLAPPDPAPSLAGTGAPPVVVPGANGGRRIAASHLVAATGLIGTVSAAAVGVWLVSRPSEVRVPWSAAPVRLTFEDGLQAEPSLSPDGNQVAYSANDGDNFDIWTRRLAGGKPVRVTSDPADDWQPDWSPDGNAVVFRSERGTGGLFVAPATGGPEQRIADFGLRPQWSPTATESCLRDRS